jgi:hypothetical protein
VSVPSLIAGQRLWGGRQRRVPGRGMHLAAPDCLLDQRATSMPYLAETTVHTQPLRCPLTQPRAGRVCER